MCLVHSPLYLLSYRRPFDRTCQKPHLALPPVVRGDREDRHEKDVNQEVGEEDLCGKPFPLLLQKLVQGLDLEHFMTILKKGNKYMTKLSENHNI